MGPGKVREGGSSLQDPDPEEWVVARGRGRGGARGDKKGRPRLAASVLGSECFWASGKMAARGLGRSLGRFLCSPSWRLRKPVRPLRGVSAPAAATAQLGSYQAQSVQAAREPAAFWGPLARDTLVWDTPYHTVWNCDFSSGKIGWFLGGQLNVSGEWAAGDPGRPQLTRPEGT